MRGKRKGRRTGRCSGTRSKVKLAAGGVMAMSIAAMMYFTFVASSTAGTAGPELVPHPLQRVDASEPEEAPSPRADSSGKQDVSSAVVEWERPRSNANGAGQGTRAPDDKRALQGRVYAKPGHVNSGLLLEGFTALGWKHARSPEEADIVLTSYSPPTKKSPVCVRPEQRCGFLVSSVRISNKCHLREQLQKLETETESLGITQTREVVPEWRNKAGITLDFYAGHVLPTGFHLDSESETRRCYEAVQAQLAAHEDPSAVLEEPLLVKAAMAHLGKGVTVVWSAELLAILRDDLKAMMNTTRDPQGRPIRPTHGGNIPKLKILRWAQYYIVEKYLTRPLLLPGPQQDDPSDMRKFHIRSYMLVSSVTPPMVYYRDGYIGLGDVPFALNDFTDTTAHVTNTHTGKRDSGQVLHIESLRPVLEGRFPSHPDPLAYVRCQFERQTAAVFASAAGTLTKLDAYTVASAPPEVGLAADRFSLYGTDFFIEEDLTVWLNEVNAGPELKAGDSRVQGEVIPALIDETNFPYRR